MDFRLSGRSNRTCALANLPERVCRQFPQKGEKMALSQALRSGCLNTTLRITEVQQWLVQCTKPVRERNWRAAAPPRHEKGTTLLE